jgi:hypothetical protein
VSEWQPIETAPRDGTNMDVWCPEDTEEGGYRVADAYWSTPLQKWQKVGAANGVTWAHEPTRWMPLPEPPK